MQKITPRLLFWFLVACVAVSGLGCSDAQPRDAGRAVLEAVDYAGRLLARARYLAGAPVVSEPGSGEPGLLEPYGEVSPNAAAQAGLPPVGAVAPAALDALRQARQRLDDALRENPEVDASVKALAEAMLGRIESLRGDLQAAQAAVVARRLQADLTQLGALADRLRARGSLQAYFQDLAAPAREDLRELIDQSQERVEELTARAQELDAQIQDLQQQRKELAAENEQLIREVRKLRTDLRLVSAEQGMEPLNEALKKEETLGANESRIATIEQQVRVLRARRDDLSLQIASADSRAEAARQALQSREVWAESSPGPGALEQDLAAAREQVEAVASDVQLGVEEFSRHQSAARQAFAQAAEHFSKAGRLEARERRAETISSVADEWMSEAGVISRKLDLQQRASRLAEQLRTIWQSLPGGAEPPVVVAALEELASGMAEARTEAAALYERAARQYAQAVSAAPRNGEWAYQFQQADAYIGRFLLTGQEEARQQATEALARASQGRAESPYIRPQLSAREQVLAGS